MGFPASPKVTVRLERTRTDASAAPFVAAWVSAAYLPQVAEVRICSPDEIEVRPPPPHGVDDALRWAQDVAAALLVEEHLHGWALRSPPRAPRADGEQAGQ